MFEHLHKIHFIGVGGIGMSALAKLMVEDGKVVSGSDLSSSEITERLEKFGIKMRSGHDSKYVEEDVDLVVYSAAVPTENVERMRSRELGIEEKSYAEFLGEVSKQFSTIVVCGTHGKSTTTAMLGLILEEAGYDPTVLVGSLVPSFKHGNLRVGKGRFFVVEGCEYKANMLELDPEMIVITNIEEDHLDYYRDLEHIRQTFQQFVEKLSGKGMVVWNADDVQSKLLRVGRGVSYAVENEADYQLTFCHSEPSGAGRRISRDTRSFARLRRAQDDIGGELTLMIPGRMNYYNALAATAAAMELGVPFETCKRALEKFGGIWRRFEIVGTWKDATVVSDYAHHPTEIMATLSAAREHFADRRLVLCFQPHQHSRTEKLFDGFVRALSAADVLVLPEIYGVAGRTDEIPPLPEGGQGGVGASNRPISSKDLADKIVGSHYAKDLTDAESILRDLVKKDDVLIIMGAGDVDHLARKLG